VILGITGLPGPGLRRPAARRTEGLSGRFFSGASLDPHGPRGVRPWGLAGHRPDRESRMGNGDRYSDGEAS